ncbi:MAG: tetratricopeptide repeat protein [Desulfobacterales bacterium]|nr:MAG: tetratricopeptide repeat protein [Desulfobacterales bacterium]
MQGWIRLTICLLLFLYPLDNGRGTEDATGETLFFTANQAYKEERYRKAVEGYRRLIENGYRNGHLYFNLGNAYFRLNDLGRAILNYERAHLLIPRDADLNYNLRYARDRTRDALPPSEDYVSQTFFWLNEFTLSELLGGFAAVNLLFWGILALRLVRRPEWSYYVWLLLLISWLVTGLSVGFKWYQLDSDDRAVILPEEVSVLAGPDSEDTVLFKLHAGTIVRQERREDGWSLIRLPDDKRGWVATKVIENIVAFHPPLTKRF